MKTENDDGIFDYAEIDGKLRNLSAYPKYNGEKADLFSCGATLFMIQMRSPPFRKAVQNDPYFKRLSSAVKQNFWKIFKSISYSPQFRELIEKTLSKYPAQRYTLDQMFESQFVSGDEVMSKECFIEEIKQRHVTVEQAKQMDLGQHNHESHIAYGAEVDVDEELIAKEKQDYHEAREKYVHLIEDISKMLRHQRNMKKIKKECLKSMIAGPSLVQENLILQKQTLSQKHSLVSGPNSTHKNSLVGPCYNSDTDDYMHQEHIAR